MDWTIRTGRTTRECIKDDPYGWNGSMTHFYDSLRAVVLDMEIVENATSSTPSWPWCLERLHLKLEDVQGNFGPGIHWVLFNFARSGRKGTRTIAQRTQRHGGTREAHTPIKHSNHIISTSSPRSMQSTNDRNCTIHDLTILIPWCPWTVSIPADGSRSNVKPRVVILTLETRATKLLSLCKEMLRRYRE